MTISSHAVTINSDESELKEAVALACELIPTFSDFTSLKRLQSLLEDFTNRMYAFADLKVVMVIAQTRDRLSPQRIEVYEDRTNGSHPKMVCDGDQLCFSVTVDQDEEDSLKSIFNALKSVSDWYVSETGKEYLTDRIQKRLSSHFHPLQLVHQLKHAVY